jgi:hypothetical protein
MLPCRIDVAGDSKILTPDSLPMYFQSPFDIVKCILTTQPTLTDDIIYHTRNKSKKKKNLIHKIFSHDGHQSLFILE